MSHPDRRGGLCAEALVILGLFAIVVGPRASAIEHTVQILGLAFSPTDPQIAVGDSVTTPRTFIRFLEQLESGSPDRQEH